MFSIVALLRFPSTGWPEAGIREQGVPPRPSALSVPNFPQLSARGFWATSLWSSGASFPSHGAACSKASTLDSAGETSCEHACFRVFVGVLSVFSSVFEGV